MFFYHIFPLSRLKVVDIPETVTGAGWYTFFITEFTNKMSRIRQQLQWLALAGD